jgi:hypothetical protein
MAVDTVNNLVSLSALKTFIGVKTTDTDYDEMCEQAIDGASWYLNSETGRKLKARDLTEYYDGDGTDKLVFEQRPINAMSSIYSDAARAFGSTTLVDSDDYELYGDEGYVVFTATGVATGHHVLKATYNAGYSTIPYDLKQACIELATLWYENYKSHHTQLKSVSSDAGTQSYEHNIPPFVKAIIKKYRKNWIL